MYLGSVEPSASRYRGGFSWPPTDSIRRFRFHFGASRFRESTFVGQFTRAPKSSAPSPLRSILEISTVESTEIGTYLFAWGSKSQLWHGCLHGNIFWRWGLGTCVVSWVNQKARPTLNSNRANFFAENNQDPTSMKIKHIIVVTWGMYQK